MKKRIDKRAWITTTAVIAVGGVVFLMCWGLRSRGTLQFMDLKVYDWMIRHQPRDHSTASEIVVVGITEDDLHNQHGVDYPIPDSVLAAIIETVYAAHPRAVGVDIFRDIPVPRPPVGQNETEGRKSLRAVWAQHHDLIFSWQFGMRGTDREVAKPLGLPDKQAGAADYATDSDGVVRRGLLFLGGKDPATGRIQSYGTFYSWLARWYLGREKPAILLKPLDLHDPTPSDFVLGKTILRRFGSDQGPYVGADAQGVQFLLDWKSPPPEDFKHFSITQLLTGKVPPEALAGKIVLIGNTAPSIKDLLITPLDGGPLPNRPLDVNGRSATYGVDVHAATVDQLLRAALYGQQPIRSWHKWQEALYLLGWALAGGLLGWRVRATVVLVSAIILGEGVLFATAWFLFLHGWWAPFVEPSIAWVAAAFLMTAYISYREKTDRLLVMQLFSRHVSRDVADTIWAERDQFLSNGKIAAQPLVATVLFTDLKGFSGVSETMSAQELMAWLNEVMDALSGVVDRCGGIVNKYIGDAVMAIFGVPVPRITRAEQALDATNAVRCALEMRRALADLNRDWQARGLPEIGMRIGIYTGSLVAGSLGSAQRMEYTVIGDTVNTAARLESFDKTLLDPDITAHHCRILIGGPTLDLLGNAFSTRSIGTLPIPGKVEKIAIHGVIDWALSARPVDAQPRQGSKAVDQLSCEPRA